MEKVLNTTHIVGYKETAEQINIQICNTLPIQNEKYLISYAKDIINGKEYECGDAEYLMKHKTNLPNILRLQVGCRVMFLNNKPIKNRIVIDINKDKNTVRVAFCIKDGIFDIEIEPEPVHLIINGIPASRVQFPLQNAFALTVHKTQEIHYHKLHYI